MPETTVKLAAKLEISKTKSPKQKSSTQKHSGEITDIAQRYATELCEFWLKFMDTMDINKNKLAQKMDVNRGWVTKVFQCKENIGLMTIARVNAALGINNLSLGFIAKNKPIKTGI